MSELVTITAIIGIVGIVAIVLGLAFRSKIDRSGIEIEANEPKKKK